MEKTVNAFLNRLQNDTDFYLEMGKASSKEKRWELIRSHGYNFNVSELEAAKENMNLAARKTLDVVCIRSQGVAEMGDIPRTVLADGCGTCE